MSHRMVLSRYHSDPCRSMESNVDEDFSTANLHIEALYFWCISAAKKVNIIKELSGLGITERTVYPISMGSRRAYGKWKCCGMVSRRLKLGSQQS